jgi:predicted transposase/invertase (TIGR01784 family)
MNNRQNPEQLPTRLNPLNDFLFEKLLGEKGDEPQLLEFLKPILARTHRELKEIQIIENKTFPPEIIGGKKGILDVRALLSDRTRCNIEIQRKNRFNMDKRSLFYWSLEYGQSLNAGEDYAQMPDVICINILDYIHSPLKYFHSSYHLYEDECREYCLTRVEELHFIEMPKYRQVTEKDIRGNALHRWLSYIDIETPLEVVKEIVAMDSAIARTQELMKMVRRDKDLLHQYQMYELARSDEENIRNGERNIGIRIGTENGIRIGTENGIRIGTENGIRIGTEKIREEAYQEKLESARGFKAIGIPPETIALNLKLPLTVVEGL